MRSRIVPGSSLQYAGTFILLSLLSAAPLNAQQTTCVRPVARTVPAGDTIRIAGTAPAPCRFVAEPTGIELRESLDGSIPAPHWTAVARDSRGRFYTVHRGQPNKILLWNADGSHAQSFGRSGAGPEEISGNPVLVIGRADSLVAFHGGDGRASIFAPNAVTPSRLMRSVPAVRRQKSIFVAADGRVVSAGVLSNEGTGFRFHVATPDGAHQKSFAPIPPGMTTLLTEMPVAYGGGTSFWSVRAAPRRDGYMLEQWSLDGALLRVIYRTAPWLASTEADARAMGTELPIVSSLSVDSRGLVWVTMGVKDPRAGVLDKSKMTDATESQFLDIRHEVIDPASGTIISSEVFPDFIEEGPDTPPIVLMIPGSSISYLPLRDSETGLARIRFFELRPVAR